MTGTENLFDKPAETGEYYLLRDLVQARKQAGRKATSVMYDFLRLSWRSKRIIDPEFYFKFRLFDVAGNNDEAMYGFMDAKSYLRVNTAINFDVSKHGAIDNKIHLEPLLRAENIPVVQTKAVLSNVISSPTLGISTVEDAVSFFKAYQDYPLFGKPNWSSRSAGVISIKCYDDSSGTLTLENKGDIGVDTFCKEVFHEHGNYGYLLQSKLKPHAALLPICGEAIGCVRLVTLKESDKPISLYAVWKIPARGEIADNFWRAGNRVAAINIKSGWIERVQIGSGVSRKLDSIDPATGEDLIGFQLPYWDELVKITCQAASLFQHAPVLGWDVAITTDGPVIVEGNTNPDHGLYQLANGVGFATSPEGQRLNQVDSDRRSLLKKLNKEMKYQNREFTNAIAKKAVTQGFKVSKPAE